MSNKIEEIGKNLDKGLPEEIQGVFIKSIASSDSSAKEQSSKGSDGGEKKSIVSASGQEKQNIDGGNAMADEKTIDIEQKVEATVKNLLKQKDAEAAVAKAMSDKDAEIAGLKAGKASVEKELSDAKAVGANLSSELETVKASVATLTAQVTTLASEKETALSQATAAQAKLDQIEAEKTLAARTQVLTDASILMPEGEMRVKQVAKITAMTQEDFDAYVAETSALVIAAKTPEKKLTPEEQKAMDEKMAADKKKKSCASESAPETEADGRGEALKKALASVPDVSGADILTRTIATANAGAKCDANMVGIYAGF